MRNQKRQINMSESVATQDRKFKFRSFTVDVDHNGFWIILNGFRSENWKGSHCTSSHVTDSIQSSIQSIQILKTRHTQTRHPVTVDNKLKKNCYKNYCHSDKKLIIATDSRICTSYLKIKSISICYENVCSLLMILTRQ